MGVEMDKTHYESLMKGNTKIKWVNNHKAMYALCVLFSEAPQNVRMCQQRG